MKPYQKLREVHESLTAYQREQIHPLPSIARIITEVEKTLQTTCNPDAPSDWPHCPLWRRVEAIEKTLEQLRGVELITLREALWGREN